MKIPVKTLIAFLAVMVPALLRAQTVVTVTGGVAVEDGCLKLAAGTAKRLSR